MLLRRIIDHVKAQNWTAVTLDFFIVVIGVLLAFQITAWNDLRQNASRTQGYYKRLIADLESERTKLRARVEYFSTIENYGKSALDALGDPAQMHTSQFLIDTYHASQYWSYAPQRATYDEILSSGVAEAIPDPELRTHLANFYSTLESAAQIALAPSSYRDNIRSYLPYEIQFAIRANCNDKAELREDGIIILTLPASCPLEFDQDEIEKAIAALQGYQSIKPELIRKVSLNDTQRKVAVDTLAMIDTLITQLEARTTK